MSNPRDDRYYSSLGKSRRTSPAGDSGGFFQTGQGGRTVLPPLSSAFPTSRFPVSQTYPNQYSQPRSSPGRYDYNPSLYNQWPNNAPAPQPTSSFTYYESHDNRYPAQQSYPSYTSRTPPTIPDNPSDSRRLAPLHIGREERWQTSTYPTAVNVPTSSHIRSPTASYPTAYAAYPSTNQGNPYSYSSIPAPDPRAHPSMNPQPHASSLDRMVPSRGEPRAPSPYTRSSSNVSPPTYTPPPVTPTSADEPMIKKKRKRADAAQLKVLNETYNRTAFPSTEERLALAKTLDMSARSVQIWFQNKRQSMRQTNRQSSTMNSGSHQSFSMPSQSDAMIEDMGHTSTSGYGGGSLSMAGSSYISRSPQDTSRSVAHATQSPSSSHRRPRAQEDNKLWNGRDY